MATALTRDADSAGTARRPVARGDSRSLETNRRSSRRETPAGTTGTVQRPGAQTSESPPATTTNTGGAHGIRRSAQEVGDRLRRLPHRGVVRLLKPHDERISDIVEQREALEVARHRIRVIRRSVNTPTLAVRNRPPEGADEQPRHFPGSDVDGHRAKLPRGRRSAPAGYSSRGPSSGSATKRATASVTRSSSITTTEFSPACTAAAGTYSVRCGPLLQYLPSRKPLISA